MRDDPYDEIDPPNAAPRRPERAWAAGPPVDIGPDTVAELPAILARHDGPIALADLEAWPVDALDEARFHLSCEPAGRPAGLDHASVSLDMLLDAIVDAIDTLDGPARRVRPDGMTVEQTERVHEVMYTGEGEARFYVDRVRRPMAAEALYDLFEEALFPEG